MDLIEEYFKRDLTEAEDDLLSKILEASPEKAELFAQRMETFYRKDLGAQAPAWPGGTLPLPAFPWKRWALGILLAFGALLAYWAMRPTPKMASVPALTTQPASATQPVPSLRKEPEAAAESKQRDIPNEPKEVKVPVQPRTPSLPASTLPPPLPRGNEGERLSVTVHRTQSGLATVKVVDPAGRPVRTLYAGILPAGSRSFTWDGKMDNGLVAEPGRYFLEMRTGSNVQKQELRLGTPE